ncbi:MAG TPA: hypothetical protein VD978_20475 [Azospirillum sp.]|nr:hypothetical protein [Azospirillum sp.]
MRVIEEKGSFRLVENGGRHAVVEVRNGQVYDVRGDGDRAGQPDTPAGIDTVARWTDEEQARGLLDELAARGNDLAKTIW